MAKMNKPREHGRSFQCRVTSEAVSKFNKSSDVEEIDSSQSEPIQPRNKILIQRVFHQPKTGVVEQKLDYIVATSDEEITKHVFGGLFHNKYYPYRPEDYCRKHDPNLDEHIDETMPKLGDKFSSLETFRLYVDSNARHWKYYLKCSDSHKGNGKFAFVYRCVFANTAYNYNAKGLRKRTAKLPKGNCPCRVLLKAVPPNSDTLTVIYVCNHHDHPVTDEYFEKLQHGRRVHPSIKEEIMDFLSLDVDRHIVKKHFETLTGFKMGTLYFNNLLLSMKKNNMERQFTLERLKEISWKVGKIKEDLGIAVDNNVEETIDDDLDPTDKAAQINEAINVLKAVAAPMKAKAKPLPQRTPSAGKKRSKISTENSDEDPSEMAPVTNKSRLETRLQELTFDQETLQSIKHLQDSVRGDNDEWSSQHELDSWDRSITGHRKKRIRNTQKDMPVIEPEFETQTVVIDNTKNIELPSVYGEQRQIVYDENMGVMETPGGNGDEIIFYQNQIENNDASTIDAENGVNYCIQYEDGTVPQEQGNEQYIFIENLENLPEVRIQATDYATVSIVSPNKDTTNETQIKTEPMQDDTSIANDVEIPNIKTESDDSNNVLVKVEPENIKVLGNEAASFEFETDTVYEIIETNDRKIYPRREVVLDFLNKPPPRKKSLKNSNVIDDAASTEPKEDRYKQNSGQGTSDVENLNRLLKPLVNEDNLEKLGDDEYYMVVVNDEDIAIENQVDKGYDDFKQQLDAHLHETEPRTGDVALEKYLDETVIHCVNKKVQCSFVTAGEIEREMSTISRLKRIKRSLEQDIKQLMTTKDGLVKEIMKARKSKRQSAYDDD